MEEDQELDLRMGMSDIYKRIELLGSSHKTWKERKYLENKKVVALGGKPPKKQRLPLSIARAVMKKQKDREQKKLQENVILGRFGGKLGGGSKRSVDKRRPEDRVLRASEGFFKNGVLDVKHLLRPTSSIDNNGGGHNFRGPKKGSGKKGGERREGIKVRRVVRNSIDTWTFFFLPKMRTRWSFEYESTLLCTLHWIYCDSLGVQYASTTEICC